MKLWMCFLNKYATITCFFFAFCYFIYIPESQGRIKAGADGAAAPGPPTKIGLSITTYYEQLSDFFINQLFYFKVEYELPIFIGLIYPI